MKSPWAVVVVFRKVRRRKGVGLEEQVTHSSRLSTRLKPEPGTLCL